MTQELLEDQSHCFSLPLPPGAIAEIAVTQPQQLDLVLTLDNPSGAEVRFADVLADGKERILWAASSAPAHVQVRDLTGTGGDYELELTVHANPTPRDFQRQRLAAQLADIEGNYQAARDRSQEEEFARARQIAIDQYRTLAPNLKSIGASDLLATAYYRRADLLSKAQQHRKLVALGPEAIQHLVEANSPPEHIGWVHQWLAMAHGHISDQASRQHHGQEALFLALEIASAFLEASANNELAQAAQQLNNLSDAEQLFQTSAQQFLDLGRHNDAVIAYTNLAGIYIASWEEDKMLETLGLAEEETDKNTPLGTRSFLREIWGQAHLRRKEFDEAREAFEEALDLAEQDGDYSYQAAALNGLANLCLLEDPEHGGRCAIEYHQLAMEAWEAIDNQGGIASTKVSIGKAHYLLEETKEAQQILEEALPEVKESGRPMTLAPCLLTLGKLARDRGDWLTGLAYAVEAIELVEDHRSGSAAIEQRSAIQTDRQHYYDTAIEILLELDQLKSQPSRGSPFPYREVAFRLGEQARGRRLLDLFIAGGPNGNDLDKSVSSPQESTAIRLSEAAQNWRKNREKDPVGDESEALGTDLERELTAALAAYSRELSRLPSNLTNADRDQILGIAETQELLSGGDLLLSYDLGARVSHLWAISRDEVELFRLPARSIIEDTISKLKGALVQSKSGIYGNLVERRAEALSEMLLAPAAHLLNKGEVLIIADGPLHSLPFALLPHPNDPDNRPLGMTQPLSFPPSSSNLAQIGRRAQHRRSKRKRSSSRPMATIADPVFSRRDPRTADFPPPLPNENPSTATYSRLPHSGQEADALELLAPQGSESFRGFDANFNALSGDALSPFGTLHFATHAEVDRRRHHLSSLLLSALNHQGNPQPEDRLAAHQIRQLTLTADLVVLAACETGDGQEQRGEGFIGLTEAFLEAGASSVLVTLWPVGDLATARFMEHFYTGLYSHQLTSAAALQHAMAQMLEEPDFNDPQDWAGFVLRGDG